MLARSRALAAGVILVGFLAHALPLAAEAAPAAEASASTASLGGYEALESSQKARGGLKPAAYRSKEDVPFAYRPNMSAAPSYSAPSYDSYKGQGSSYPNAHSDYQSYGYEEQAYASPGRTYPAYPTEPIRGYGTPHYAAEGYAAVQYPAAGGPYQQPYTATYQAPYQAPAEPYASAHYPTKDPYWHSYQPAPYSSGSSGYYATEAPTYGRGYDVRGQQPLPGSPYRSTAGAYSLQATPPRQHHPTVAHQEDPYKQQQQALSALSTQGALSILGSSIAARSKQAANSGVSGGSAAGGTDAVSQQWWKDHQQLQPTTNQPAGDKLDALLTLINKIAP